MASTEKLPSGRYRGVYHDSAGKKQHTETVDRKRDALAAAVDAESKAKRQAAAKKGTLGGHTTYEQVFPLWWEDRGAEPSTESTEERTHIKLYVMPQWREWEVAQIGQPDVQRWINSLHRDKGLSGSYVRRIYTPFRASINYLVREEILTASPCVNIKLPPKSGGGVERLYAPDELVAIRKELVYEYRFASELIEETGLRPGEFAGLHRWRVDRKAGWVTIRDTYDRTAKRIKSYPKDDEERHVPLTTRACDLLDEWYEKYPPIGPNCGLRHQSGKCRSDLLFRQPNSRGPMDPNNFWRSWSIAQRKAEITPPGRPYDLRHLFGTRLAEAGVDPWEIARLMGHATLEQSSDYIHRTQSARRRILAALGDPAASGLTAVTGGQTDTENDQQKEDRTATRPTSVPRSMS